MAGDLRNLDDVQRDWGVTDASVHRLADAPDVVLIIRHFDGCPGAGSLTNREFRLPCSVLGVERTAHRDLCTHDAASLASPPPICPFDSRPYDPELAEG
ncbi:MAG: hypothetical protein R2855_10040 [Thermomicrobiales bacterium]